MAITWESSAVSQWAVSTAYAHGARVVNPPSAGAALNVYEATVGGTSSASAGGPVGTTSTPIVDGTVTWSYLGTWTGAVVDVDAKLASLAGSRTLLQLAETIVSDAVLWGSLFDDGRRYLAAHYGQMARLNGKGMISSEGLGPLSRSYAALMGTTTYGLTSAGLMFRTLARSTVALFGSVP